MSLSAIPLLIGTLREILKPLGCLLAAELSCVSRRHAPSPPGATSSSGLYFFGNDMSFFVRMMLVAIG